ncbi:hypothetical protein H0A64_15895 [Alcaligenaceae bacterium]|nr:hypothetical protein [Alcaligenaceae bacterium]
MERFWFEGVNTPHVRIAGDAQSLRPFASRIVLLLRFMKTSAIDRLLILAFFGCFIGGSLYLVAPIRPVHIGFLAIIAAGLASKDLRALLFRTHYLTGLVALLFVLGAQALWVENWVRYVRYSVFLGIGFGLFFLGGAIVARRVDIRWPIAACTLVWFVIAFFPFFDDWAGATEFRGYLLTGGPWGNPNTMATVLVFASLLWFVFYRRMPWALFFCGWFYVILLSRRADTVAFAIFSLSYLLFFAHATWAKRLWLLSIWVLVTVISALAANNASLIRATQSSSNTFTQAITLKPESTTSQSELPSFLVEKQNGLAAPNDTLTAESVASASSLLSDLGLGSIRPGADAIRLVLIADMLEAMGKLSWWQWVLGQGAGQLDLTWSPDNSRYASPHFFWLEMFFYVGIGWFALLTAMFWSLDWRGRVAMVAMGVAGVAPSSIITVGPFWCLFGALFFKAFIEKTWQSNG